LVPDAVFAEVVHLSEGRVANILCRPVLRDYEIPFLGRSGAPRDRQLPPDDLLVSVVGDRVVLKSKRLGREVLPRLTSAHNYQSRSLGVYRFLGMLQRQGSVSFQWGWGGAFADAPFLPRVRYGKAVLYRARWRLGPEELARLREQGADSFALVQALRAERRLPRFVVLADGDNELPIDLDNPLSVDCLVHAVRRRPEAVLRELYPPPDELVANGPEGGFCSETVIAFSQRREPTTRVPRNTPEPSRRRFVPGSEWLYARLYCGEAAGDRTLLHAVAPVAGRAVAEGVIDKWFFLRYGHPDHHLRVRLHGDPEALRLALWPCMSAALEPLLDDGTVWRVELATYEREAARYGGEHGVELSETMFWLDSEAVCEALMFLEERGNGRDDRWRIAMLGADWLLEDLGLDPAARLEIYRGARARFADEFGVGAAFFRQLGERFRAQRGEIAAVLSRDPRHVPAIAPACEALRRRSDRSKPLCDELRARERDGRLSQPLDWLGGSLQHLHVNRVLRSAQRAQELVLYDLLRRHYESELARARKRVNREPRG
jgi:thiopeptide-type bacteriocin biosynthesis protein